MPHAANDALRISDAGLTLIEQFEGFEPDWYLDPVGVPTIAFGWTGALPDGLTPPLTRGQGRQLLRQTVGRYGDAVREAIDVPLQQGQYDALVSFTYNLGGGALRQSTLRTKLNAGDPAGAAAEFDRWVRAGGRVYQGLVRRRAAERALFESAGPPTPSRLADRAVLQREADLADRTLGTLTAFDDEDHPVLALDTLELPWRDNRPGLTHDVTSRVRAGTYAVTPYDSERYPNTYKLEDRHGRTNILIHPGNWPEDLSGTIAVGLRRADLDGDGLDDVTLSRKAVAALERVFGRSEPWTLEIRDSADASTPAPRRDAENPDTPSTPGRPEPVEMERIPARPPHPL